MSFTDEIRQLIKNRMVIRHRSGKEQPGGASSCLICHRDIILPAGALCLAIDNEGLVCPICGKIYAPEMMSALGENRPAISGGKTIDIPEARHHAVSTSEWIDIARDIDALAEISTDLAKGIARGIVEAPAGHIGLMHYAKDIHKPPRKESESDKQYELRVRTNRMTRLYEKIYADTTGRVEKLKNYLVRLGLPAGSD
jgi:hypothetical protein